jgi:hypothetical protein
MVEHVPKRSPALLKSEAYGFHGKYAGQYADGIRHT